MKQQLLHTVWRLATLALVLIGAYLTAFVLIPYLDKKLPIFWIILVVYFLLAYGIFPLIIKFWRIIFKPNHIPHFVTTGDGWPSDPITFAVLSKDKRHLEKAMAAAGWYKADEWNFKNALRELQSMVFNKPYPAAPLSNLYLFGRKQDIGFEIPTNRAMSARTRHHVRFWRLQETSVKNHNPSHHEFWIDKLKRFIKRSNYIWIAAATEEPFPIDIQWRTGQLTHAGSHDAERERDFIIDSLKRARYVKSISSTVVGEETRFRGQQFRTIYITDGSIKVVELKKPLL